VRRSIVALSERVYDLVIVGGGIFGVCAAWDAAQRGLSVALVEKEDFAHATSANCFKIVHGGIRYLQHGDIIRVRQSSKERNAFLRMAPHLVHPFPIVIPTYGHGVAGKGLLRAGVLLYDLLTWDRNRGVKDPGRAIPRGHFISREEALDLFPSLERKELTGAAIIYDGHMYNPPRLALAFLRSAVEAGAIVANYVGAVDFLRTKQRVAGIQAKDMLTGEEFPISGRVVLNAAGPWAEHLLESQPDLRLQPQGTYSRDACFVVARRLTGDYALAIQGRTSDPDAILSRKRRHLFIVPWRDYTLIGVWHIVHQGLPGEFTLTEEELQSFIDEINEAYPAFQLTRDDVSMWNAGLVLFGENKPGATDLSYGKRSRVVDHARSHGIEGLVTLIGVRYTTARGDALRVVDLVCKKLERKTPHPVSPATPVYGGQIECFEEFVRRAAMRRPAALSAEVMHALVRNHGSEYEGVLKYIREDGRYAETVGSSTVLKAEIVHAVREEMAQKLADMVFRRTDLGTGERPKETALKTCADLMGEELGWDEGQKRNELAAVQGVFARYTHTVGTQRESA